MSSNIRANIRNFLDFLANAEIAIHVNPITEGQPNRITWIPLRDTSREIFRRRESTIADYVDWVHTGSYSAMLFDGSLLQITFDYEGSDLTGHRLAFVPCPFLLDYELLQTEPIADVIDLYLTQNARNVRMQTSIRFDFDPQAQRPGHAAAHASFNSVHCRIPCISALNLGHFASFIFQHFYPELWKVHTYLQRLPREPLERRTILPDEEAFIHLSWRATRNDDAF